MATVSLHQLKNDSCTDRRPRLILQDVSASRPRVKRRVHRQNRSENVLFAVAVVAVLLYFLLGSVQAMYRAARAVGHAPLASSVLLPVTVHPGDTLWQYAQKYGAPNSYILDRVETIAHANGLSPDAALVPGQHLHIPVTNPVLVAQLESAHRLARR